MTSVRGAAAPGFEPFGAAVAAMAGDGAPTALVAVHGGDVVADLAAGQDALGRPFTTDRQVYVYSAIKPVVALAALSLVAEKRLDVDAPVATYWPAFGQHDKGAITLRTALAHGAAVPGWRPPLDIDGLLDWDHACAALADQPPWHTPGEPAEHALTYGHLIGEVVRRTTGHTLADLVDAVAGRAGLAVSLRPATGPRAPAPLTDTGSFAADVTAPDRLASELLRAPVEVLDVGVVNSARFRAAQVPAISGYASAAALARLWWWWVGGTGAADLLGETLRMESLTPTVVGHDHVLDQDVAWALGPQVDEAEIGMGGIGGCAGWYDRDFDLAIGVTTTVPSGGSARLDAVDTAITSLR